MTGQLAHIVAQANIQGLALIGLSKNVGKTTTTNHLLETLISERLYSSEELALTSLGLDGESIDALTGLPKPRYVPQDGLLVATSAALLRQAEREGLVIERLLQLPGRTALGPVMIARVRHAGRLIIAGPTLLKDIRFALERLQAYGSRLSMVDGAINRLGAAIPAITDACILCTGASAGATPDIVAHRTADMFIRLTVEQSQWRDAYRNLFPHARLLAFFPSNTNEVIESTSGLLEPTTEAMWIAEQMREHSEIAFFLRGAFTEELSRALLAQLPSSSHPSAELVVGDGIKIFCHSVVLQRLAVRGLHIRVAEPIRVLALTINPYVPEYVCTTERLLDCLIKVLPESRPPIIDVVAGTSSPS